MRSVEPHRGERASIACLLVALVVGCAPMTAQPSAVQAPLASPGPPTPAMAYVPPVLPPAAIPHADVPAPRVSAPVAKPTPAAAPPPTAAPRDPLAPDPRMIRLLGGGGAALKSVIATPEKYRFQVLYGVVGEGASPTLERHSYRAGAEYFFPASSMKVPIALAMVERLEALRRAGKPALTREAKLRILPVNGGASEPYVTTLARETWRALIVSDNFSANRLLGFVGHREVNETLWGLGLASARIHHGFATGAEIDPAELSPRIEITTASGAQDELAARKSDLTLPPTTATKLDIGEAHIADGRKVPGPLSFAAKNAMSLRELQDTLVRIVRPDLLPPGSPVDQASKEDLAYLRQTLGTLPSQSGLAGYDRNVVADYQLSPFLRGIERVRARGHFELYSKVGQAYGFLIGNAYIVDKDTGRALFLTAAVYANPDETINDDDYGYDAISFPALADVGEAFCRDAFVR